MTRKRIRLPNAGRINRGPFVCVQCDKEYTTTRPKGEGEQFCSRDCSFAYKTERSQQKKAEQAEQRIAAISRILTCRVCGVEFERSTGRVWCSGICKKKEANSKTLERNKSKRADLIIKCSVCGLEFKPLYGDKRKSICSDKCSRHFNKHRKRARHYKVRYEPISAFKVFDRDSWTCQICGIKTPKKFKGMQLSNSPELDHRVPISKGGDHLYVNVQCSCRKCNILKGNRNSAGQLQLF